jgi:hypothetical protein
MVAFDRMQCETLEEQFIDMFHAQLDDFESNMQQIIRKKEIAAVVDGQSDKSHDQFQKDVHRLTQLNEYALDFNGRISRLTEEFFLLKRHMASLDMLQNIAERRSVLDSYESPAETVIRQYASYVYHLSSYTRRRTMASRLY